MNRIASDASNAESDVEGPSLAPRATVMITYLVDRRAFIEQAAMIVSSYTLSPRLKKLAMRAPLTVRIGFTASSPSDHRLGFDLGVDEAQHAATMFGGTLESRTLRRPDASDGDLTAIIGAADASTSAMWARHAGESGTLYMNVGCSADALRAADCSSSAFHVFPSDAMLHDALTFAHLGGDGDVRAWDSTLSRFGADTLNKRFSTRFHKPMTSAAWAAWFAVKVVWEAALRQRSGRAASVSDFLMRDTTQFDGHKGSPLSFRSWDHQLRQPLYVTEHTVSGSVLTEVPKLGPDDSPRAALDRLGGDARSTKCKLGP